MNQALNWNKRIIYKIILFTIYPIITLKKLVFNLTELCSLDADVEVTTYSYFGS